MQIADVFEAMETVIGEPLETLSADGGATANSFLMQLQADLLGRTVQRSDVEEVGALGAAAMAFAALGIDTDWSRSGTRFDPAMEASARQSLRTSWHDAVSRTRSERSTPSRNT